MTPCVKEFVQKHIRSGRTLEVGALDINGNVREICGWGYVGVDRVMGANVDIQMDGHRIKYMKDTFDNVLSLDSLEHDEMFWATVSELKRVLKPGGLLILTVPWFYFPPHDIPDYWRFSGEAIRYLLRGMGIVDLIESVPYKHVMACAIKVAEV